MLTARDLLVATAASLLTAGSLLAYTEAPKLIGPSVYDFNKIPVSKTDVGEIRQFLKGPTATLKELELHVTTLDAGKTSHPPHQHPNEELVMIDQGTVETLSDGQWRRLGPGSVIFNASNSLHGLRNVGSGPAIYHVVNWQSPTCADRP